MARDSHILTLLFVALYSSAHALLLKKPSEDVGKLEQSVDADEDPWEAEERSDFEKYLRNFKPSEELKAAWGSQWEEFVGLEKGKRPAAKKAAVDACLNLLMDSDFDVTVLEGNTSLEYCKDPWFKERDCTQAFSLPNYRLGDVVKFSEPTWKQTLGISANRKMFPDSIARKYLELVEKYGKKGKDGEGSDGMVYGIINGKEYANYEKPDAKDVVVHIRAGDVAGMSFQDERYASKLCAGHRQHACQSGMAKTAAQWREDVEKVNWTNVTRVFMVSGDHKHPKAGLRGASKSLLDKVESLIKEVSGVQNIVTRWNYNADCDFIFAANASPDRYVKSGGGYDELIYRMMLKKAGIPYEIPKWQRYQW